MIESAITAEPTIPGVDDSSTPQSVNGKTGSVSSPDYRSFRARRENETALINPPACESELLVKQNRDASAARWSAEASDGAATDSSFWKSLGQSARHQLIGDARRYTSAYRNVPSIPCDPSQPIVMAGHQPTLFHPGVWFKNYALDRIGSETGAHSINLVIDNDVASSRSIRVPVCDSLGRVRARSIAYDIGGSGIPFEQAKIRDLRQFDGFELDVSRAISPIVADPLIHRLWPHARDAIRRCEIAGCALAQARHSLEGELGWQTLEIPLGVAVRGVPFARFVMEIIDQAERFQTVYNDSADRYRAWHGIRSNAHPVPNLSLDSTAGEVWRELPLWLYGNDSPMRRPVWVRRVGDELELSDRDALNPASLWLPANDRERAAEVLADHANPEWKLRPRALVTTMFARLALSDLFLHGIGGGKYDQLADQIMTGFFGIVPPAFQVVSATVRLPGQTLDHQRDTQLADLKRQIRDTRYQGERLLSGNEAVTGPMRSAIETKRRLLDSTPPQGERGQWQRQIEEVNAKMSEYLVPMRRRLSCELDRLRTEAVEEAILASREWSFCLFPLDELVESFGQMFDRERIS